MILRKLGKFLNEEVSGYGNPLDQWLQKNGWKETHGIGLYTNKKFPGVGVDSNPGDALVYAYENEREIFNKEGTFIGMAEGKDTKSLEKFIIEATLVHGVYNGLKKKYGKMYDKFHLTSHSISAFSQKGNPAITVYYDTIATRGKVIITLGGGHRVKWKESRYEVPAKMDKSLVKNVLKTIDKGLKEFESVAKER